MSVRQHLVVSVMLSIGIFASSAFAAAQPPAASNDAKSPCFTCHADIAKSYVHSRHAVKDGRAPGNGCAI